jgi:hypothetical protein
MQRLWGMAFPMWTCRGLQVQVLVQVLVLALVLVQVLVLVLVLVLVQVQVQVQVQVSLPRRCGIQRHQRLCRGTQARNHHRPSDGCWWVRVLLGKLVHQPGKCIGCLVHSCKAADRRKRHNWPISCDNMCSLECRESDVLPCKHAQPPDVYSSFPALHNTHGRQVM